MKLIEAKPKLSIITVTYNCVGTLERTINSVLCQGCDWVEYIIIDGGSTDGSLDIIRRYQDRFGYWISEPDRGIYDAMNKGILKAKGEWIYFLGADDVFYSRNALHNIDRKGAFCNKNMLFYGDVFFLNSKKRYGGEFDSKRLIRENICHQAIFFRKGVFDIFGLYNTNYKLLADWEFNMRVFNKVGSQYLDSVVCIFNEGGVSSQSIDHVFSKVYYFKLFKYFGVIDVIRFIIHKIIIKTKGLLTK